MIDLDTLATALERRTTLAWCIEHVPADGDVDAVIARAWRGRVRRKTTDDYEAMSTLLVSAGRLAEVRAAEGKAPLWAPERVWTVPAIRCPQTRSAPSTHVRGTEPERIHTPMTDSAKKTWLVLERAMLELDTFDEPTADRLRDLMDPIWYAMTDQERAELNSRDAA